MTLSSDGIVNQFKIITKAISLNLNLNCSFKTLLNYILMPS